MICAEKVRELRFPVAQNIRFHPYQLADLTNTKEQLIGDFRLRRDRIVIRWIFTHHLFIIVARNRQSQASAALVIIAPESSSLA